VGTLALDPAVPVVGQPLTVRLTVTDPFLITSQPLIPFESVRAGDIVEGNLQAGSQPGVYQATFTPKEPGRRWLSAFINVEEVRTAATASFVAYPPSQAATQAPQGDRSVILRPEPGPDPSAPGWLQRVAVPVLIVLFGAAGAGAAVALRAERRRPRPSLA
jgi:hypothetical protein